MQSNKYDRTIGPGTGKSKQYERPFDPHEY